MLTFYQAAGSSPGQRIAPISFYR